jgi:hypothetical protein
VLASQREAEIKYSKVKEEQKAILKSYSETYHAPVKKPPPQETIDNYLSQARAAGTVAGSTRNAKRRAASTIGFFGGDSSEEDE